MPKLRCIGALSSVAICLPLVFAAHPTTPGCGTHGERTREELYLHRQSQRSRVCIAKTIEKPAAAVIQAHRDAGNIAILDDADGVIARRNPFNLNGKTIAFSPSAPGAARYRVAATEDSYNPALAEYGEKQGLGDDDSLEIALPFAFPFYGGRYRSVYVNSDGNLTFGGSFTLTERGLGMLVGGRPRIAGLFTDLDPSAARGRGGVYVLSEPWRFVVTWRSVPLYSDFGTGVPQTFQIRMYADGAIELAYSDVSVPVEAAVGISPGGGKGTLALFPLVTGSPEEFSGPVADRFSGSDSIDIATAAQKFYATHDDAYDYLVFFNAVGVRASDTAVAFEVTARNHRTGYGDKLVEAGEDFGSGRRLQAVLNMGPLSQYPQDPNGLVADRFLSGDTGLTVLAHEAGHLFLAFASVRDPNDPAARPMLGRALAHWAFNFNSEASVLEGNRIQDNGEAAAPRFRTIAAVEGYAPLDQYLMGFRAPEEVPPTFLVERATVSASRAPQVGVAFNGQRRNVSVDDIIAAEGRRTPDHTVAQRRFRFAFVLVTAAGTEVPQDQLAKLEAYRAAFEQYYARAASDRASADTSLKRAIQLSAWPAAGVLLNGTGAAAIALQTPSPIPLTILLRSASGAVQTPGSVVVPAGATRVVFSIRGVREGVDDLTATPSDSAYETTVARIQVAGSAAALRLTLVSPEHVSSELPANTVMVRVTDLNGLPYSGVRVSGIATNGTLSARDTLTDENGLATFQWTPALSTGSLRVSLDGAGAAATVPLAPRPVVFPSGVANAASFAPGITPGSLATIFGTGLSAGATARSGPPLPFALGGVQVLIDGFAARLSYVSDSQINFLVPADLAGSVAVVEVDTPAGRSAAYPVTVSAVSPGIFILDSANQGAVLIAGAGQTTFERPARSGDTVEIYATGLRSNVGGTLTALQVQIDNVPANVQIATPLAGFPGLYQINATVPPGLASGDRTLTLTLDGVASNPVRVRIQ